MPVITGLYNDRMIERFEVHLPRKAYLRKEEEPLRSYRNEVAVKYFITH